MQVDPLLATIVAALIGLLLGTIGWFLRKDYLRIEKQVEDERARRETELKNEREARAKDKHDLREEIQTADGRRQALEVKIAGEYVNDNRLIAALQPLTESVDRFRDDIKELFTKVDGKQDKVHRGGD